MLFKKCFVTKLTIEVESNSSNITRSLRWTSPLDELDSVIVQDMLSGFAMKGLSALFVSFRYHPSNLLKTKS